MPSSRNLSPTQLSALTALILSVPISVGIFFMEPYWWIAVIAFVIIFAGSYGLILFTLQKFIYRKIKLIYKLIYQTKASKREEFYYRDLLPKKGIDEVREDVERWALQKTSEIETLKKNEIFRKEFLQNLSHEIKTPIFAVQGYVDTLLGGALDNPGVNKRFLESTARNVDRLVNLVDDLDEISKLETGDLKLKSDTFIIQELLQEVYDGLQFKAKEKSIRLFIRKECETPIAVQADKERVRQVLSNLTENAINYGKENGRVEASFYNVDGEHVLTEISDDGYGIAEEHLPRIFERFYRTDAARSRRAGGSGLGLSICKHIIEAHNQNIHVRSKIDVGTSFGFMLPKAKA